jgi:hypothetical protein
MEARCLIRVEKSVYVFAISLSAFGEVSESPKVFNIHVLDFTRSAFGVKERVKSPFTVPGGVIPV